MKNIRVAGKNIAATAVLFFFAVYMSGCATTGPKTELRTTEFQNTLGAALAIAGMGYGAYEGSRMSGGGGAGLAYGVLGGLAGGTAVGLAYWGLMNLVGERAETGGRETQKEDMNILLPKE